MIGWYINSNERHGSSETWNAPGMKINIGKSHEFIVISLKTAVGVHCTAFHMF